MLTNIISTKLNQENIIELLKEDLNNSISKNNKLVNLTNFIISNISYEFWVLETHQNNIPYHSDGKISIITFEQRLNFISPYSPYSLNNCMENYDKKLDDMRFGRIKFIHFNDKNIKRYDEQDFINGVYIFIKSLLYIMATDINSYGNSTKMLNIDMISHMNRIVAYKYIKYLTNKYGLTNNEDLNSYMLLSENIIN